MLEILNESANGKASSSASTTRSCPLASHGCDENLKLTAMREHYLTEQHQKHLVELTVQQITQQKTSDSDVDTAVQQQTLHLRNYYESLFTSIQTIETLSDELTCVDSDVHKLKTQLSTFLEKITETKVESLSHKAHINATSINQKVLTQDVSEMKQQMNATQQRVFDGTMVWKISHVREKMCDAQSERQTSIYSPPFYTSAAGYKLCVRLYLNGDGTTQGTHLSIFLVILRGRYDALLQWPFNYRVSFCLFDQRTMLETGEATKAKHIIDSFRPDTHSISFQRPQSAMNIASGIAKFALLSDLDQPSKINRYIIDDTIFIKVFIDFVGLPRAMLSFIFSINIALPLEIQQKLIDVEIKRLAEPIVQ